MVFLEASRESSKNQREIMLERQENREGGSWSNLLNMKSDT